VCPAGSCVGTYFVVAMCAMMKAYACLGCLRCPPVACTWWLSWCHAVVDYFVAMLSLCWYKHYAAIDAVAARRVGLGMVWNLAAFLLLLIHCQHTAH
jgi:uncharacterized membrane protein